MSGIFSVIRFPQSVAVLLMVALVASAGCRSLSPISAPPTPPPLPAIPVPQIHLPPIDSSNAEEHDRYSAFRPIMPGELAQPIPTPTTSTPKIHSEPPRVESQSGVISQSAIDELNRRISELEEQLEEARMAPSPASWASPGWNELLPEPKTAESKIGSNVARSLPIVNRQGVHIYADDSQNVRIEMMDKYLFMPNVWQLSAEGEETLRAVATEIRAFDSAAVIDIEGHTDSLMGDPNNPMQKHEISTVKTRVVMDFFVSALRWDVARMSTGSFGRNRPVADNATPEGRARNNRIEIVIRNESE